MSIKKIRIKNFKNLEDVEMEIKPLTFLFGPNGSGKSSFLKALLFLSKNISPLNTGRTDYKVSDEIDLGSYKDIVSHGDVSRDIVFEFDIEGKFEFPNNSIIFDYKIKSSSENIYDYFLNVLEDKKSENRKNQIPEYSLSEYITEIEYKVKYIITFSQNTSYLRGYLKNNNFKQIDIIDQINNYTYKFEINKSNLFVDHNDGQEKNELYDTEMFCFNNKHFDKFVNHYIGQYKSSGDESLHEIVNNIYKSDNFDNHFFCFENFEEYCIYSKDKYFTHSMNNINNEDRAKLFDEMVRFYYLIFHQIQKVVDRFTKIKHLPPIRKSAKDLYVLEDNLFSQKEYYGILSFLDYDIEVNRIDRKIIEKMNIQKVHKYKNYKKPNHLKSKPHKTNSFLDEIKNESIKNSTFIKINSSLIENFNLNLIYLILKNDRVGEIVLKGKENNIIKFSDSSSGFIQIFPIVACCHISEYNRIYTDKYFNRFFGADYFSFKQALFVFEKMKEYYFENLIIEQPELHIHPKLQSELSNLFTKTISKMWGENIYFIETHSEHIIKKIQVLIAKGEFDKELVRVNYFDNRNGKTNIKKMQIEESGFFKEQWPDGFFDDSANLSWELLTSSRN